ncbi:hypothetical protein [Puniceibacterium sp. IMCC21224]|uniref:hypothetical protein n=1 Tax=Puniceibacterium sp. IMCC21224 TaxID=1618204 RepID=UPI00064DD407|nr:hypothetical protein [Puniceibacterium sp. IMCC21224]
MTLINPETRMSKLEKDRKSIAATLRNIRRELSALEKEVQAGDVGQAREAGKTLADIRYWLKAARETEAELENVKRARVGVAHSYGLDLERARSEVGCRLARLRRCCREGGIPEGSESG